MSTVFFSYSHVDASTADELGGVLSSLDIDFFRDVKDINWGDSITSKVRDALDTCVAVLVIVSPASLKSHWVPYEIGHASALRKIVLPFLTHPSLDVPHYIRDLNYVTTAEHVKDYFTNSFAEEAEAVARRTRPESHRVTFSDMQVEYLMDISRPRNRGSISGGIDEHIGREIAPYQEALDLFQSHELMRYNNGGYGLTPKGWELADKLWALKILESLDLKEATDQKDLAQAVALTDGQTEIDELKRHVDRLEECGWVELKRDPNGWSVRITEDGIAQREHRKINLYYYRICIQEEAALAFRCLQALADICIVRPQVPILPRKI